jgi:hypothetical protein
MVGLWFDLLGLSCSLETKRRRRVCEAAPSTASLFCQNASMPEEAVPRTVSESLPRLRREITTDKGAAHDNAMLSSRNAS